MVSKVKKQTVMNIVRHGVFLIVLYTLQAAILPWLGTRWVPLLLAAAAAGVGHFESGEKGALFGLFAGILCDVALGAPTIVFTILLSVVGLISGYLGEMLLSRRFPSYMLCCLVTIIIASFVQMIAPLFFRGAPIAPLLITAGIQTATSLIFAVPMYPVAKWLARKAKEV